MSLSDLFVPLTINVFVDFGSKQVDLCEKEKKPSIMITKQITYRCNKEVAELFHNRLSSNQSFCRKENLYIDRIC